MRLEDLRPGMVVKGVLPDQLVTIVSANFLAANVAEVTYKDSAGRPGNVLAYPETVADWEPVTPEKALPFDGDGAEFKLVSEAHRIRLAHLFDPVLAVHTSLVEPLPHQITAVYEEMLHRQPLRFLLADDPGSGKTIMAGLLIKELLVRGDLKRCLIVAPANLVEQWQDEMAEKFGLRFEILYKEMIEAARGGNPFDEPPLLIARLDHLARNEQLQERLARSEWDLVVCDEAHKMSASYSGDEVKYTQRYHLGEALGRVTRHFLLMTATPHNGKEADFQLFMALVDPDRFAGKYRPGVHASDAADLMRRLVKERLVKFDGTPLFPERLAYSVEYTLSHAEDDLYRQVTTYVTEEMNRAARLEGQRGQVVGFALTTLQRRLASSPEAIYQSLRRRRERLERRLAEQHEGRARPGAALDPAPAVSLVDLDELDEAPDAEVEKVEDELIDQASAASTITELEHEIATLRRLEAVALHVRRSGVDRKWEELSKILQTDAPRLDTSGRLRKLIIFSEHRDTLNYLADRIRTLLGRSEAVVTIHGGLAREERKRVEAAFKNEERVQILVATDAAGEGINLQRAHLMVNYDLPWNPNRIEQRFGRIHRIGQNEVCHLWNLVAVETREGWVFQTLLRKLENERAALGGQVFDVLGKVFTDEPLRDLLIEAIRYGDQPAVRAKLQQVVDSSLDRQHLQELLDERALARDSMDTSRVQAIREEMERYQARRLQPHFIGAFFIEAFTRLGGRIREREKDRYQITFVPQPVYHRAHVVGAGTAIARSYERVTFEKTLIVVDGKPGPAEFICPGHPLLDAVISMTVERDRDILRRGTVLVDPRPDAPSKPRLLVMLEHEIRDARQSADGTPRSVSKRLQFVEIDESGDARDAGWAPYLDYDPLDLAYRDAVLARLDPAWLSDGIGAQALRHAATHLVPAHLKEVRDRRQALIDRTIAAVNARLLAEVTFWDIRANELKDQELAGKADDRLNSAKARERAEALDIRRKQRLAELEQERHLAPLPPIPVGAALVVPRTWLFPQPDAVDEEGLTADDRRRIEELAMAKVLETERRLGRTPRAMPHNNPGYDIESHSSGNAPLLFIEVKGKAATKPTVTVSKTEILTGLNKGEQYVLAIVLVDGDTACEPVYVRRPFTQTVDFAVTSVNFDLKGLIVRGAAPA